MKWMLLSVLLSLAGCAVTPNSAAHMSSVRVATYNADNFFGTLDKIPQRADRPKSPASITALAAAIHQINADILVLQEVQTGRLLADFNRTQLADMGYSAVSVDTNGDTRGLTLAILSRYPITKVSSHKASFLDPTIIGPDAAKESNHFARDLYRVDVHLPDGDTLTIYDVHLKSTNDFKDDPRSAKWRLREATAAARIIQDETQRENLHNLLIAGDFNDPSDSQTVQALIHSATPPLHDAMNFRLEQTVAARKPGDDQRAPVTFSYKSMTSAVDTMLSSREPQATTILHTSTDASSHRPVIVRFSSVSDAASLRLATDAAPPKDR